MNKKTLLNFWVLLLCMVVGGASTAWGDTYEQLTSIADIDESAEYVLGIDGTGFHYEGTSSWGKTALPSAQTPFKYTLTKANDGKSFTAKTTIGNTTYYLQVPTSNTFSMATSTGTNTDIIIGTTQVSGTNYAVANKTTTTRHLRVNGTSGLRSYAGTTGTMAFFYKVVADVPAFTITAQSNNNSWGTVSLSGSVITATPADGYTYAEPAYTVNPANSATVVQDGNAFTVTPSANTTVTINFEAIPTHTATFSVNGVTSTQDFVEGSAIEFPANPADVSGKTFVGWVTSTIDGTIDDAPDFVTSAIMGQTDVIFYAVFAEVTPGSVQDASVTINTSTGNFPTGYGDANKFTEYTLNGVKFKIQQAYINGTKLQWRAAGHSSGTGTMYNTEALLNIQSVVITYDNSDSNKNFTLYLGDEENPSSGISITPSNDGNVYTYDCSSYNKNYFVLANGEYAGYLASIVINYKTGTPDTYSAYCTTVVAAAVEKPVITLAENPFLFSTTATITCETEGAAIKYSFDGETWNDYSSALNITATTIIYAKATKGNDESSVAQVTATKNLAETTVTVSGDLTLDLDGETNVEAGTLTAAVIYNEEAVEGAVVTWTSSNTDVAVINETTGAVTIKTTGDVTFTATYAGNSDYAEATGTKSVTIIDSKAPGSEGNPYTVAQAIDATPATGTSENVYIHGFVSKFYGDDIVSDGSNYRYYISDDGTTTNQLLVYKGKGLKEVTFANASDLEIGDEVVIYGGLTTYKSEAEVAAGNYLISRTEKPASDLTKTGDITLDYKNGATDADLTEYFTTSSTGAITYTVADETVIENADELISALKVGTTTVTVSQAATLSYKAGEIVINVTVQDTREDATTIPAINISTLKIGDEGTVSVVNPVKADEGVTFSYATSDEDVLYIEGDEYLASGIGTITITVTATPSNTNLYKPVVANFEVTVEADVKTNTEIAIDDASGSTVYGTPKSVDFTVTDNYDGELSYVISNEAIADVEIGASAITFTPKAVGTAVITISAPATAAFNAATDVEYTLTVTAPEGQETASESGFVKVTATKDITDGEYLIVNEDAGVAFDGSLESLDKADNVIEVVISNNKIDADETTAASTFTIDVANGTLQSKSGLYIGQSSYNNGLAQSETADAFTNSFSIDNSKNAVISIAISADNVTLKYNKASNQNRFRYYKSGQENIQLYRLAGASIQATLNAYGYATFCSQYPLDFSAAKGYTAWQVKSISGEVVTFEKIIDTIKGGQGILLKGEAGATVTMESDDSEELLNGNLLFGTTAPTYVDNEEYLGLSGNKFVKVNAGTIPAGKALLPVSVLPAGARELTFLFDEGGQTTGISEQITVNGEKSVYDLQGRKVEKTTKGLYIVNGRKVVVK